MVELKVEKFADRNYVFMGISNKIKYSIIITNIGDEIVRSIKVKDIRGTGAFFVPGSFSINGCKQNICGIDDYFSIGSIKPGSNVVISYEVEVIEFNPPSKIINQAVVTYHDENNIILEIASKELEIPVVNININICKVVDKSIVKVGEVISYSVLISNKSNIQIDDVIFYDDLSEALQVIPSSVLVNTEEIYPESLSSGIKLGTINAYSSKVISFQAIVIRLPNPPCISNIGRIEFMYTVSDGGILVTSIGEACSNKVVIKVLNEVITCWR